MQGTNKFLNELSSIQKKCFFFYNHHVILTTFPLQHSTTKYTTFTKQYKNVTPTGVFCGYTFLALVLRLERLF